jgi:hypothetical protein
MTIWAYVIARSLINFDITVDATGDKAISRYVREVPISEEASFFQ